jgi:hypothetical protein
MSNTILPATRRSKSAFAASAIRSQGPRQPTSGENSSRATSLTRTARSGPTLAASPKEFSDLAAPSAKVEFGGKTAGSPEAQPML